MAGHSKWANIKRKKAVVDAKRGKIFTKLIREITVASRLGGGDPDMNPRLRDAIAEAKGANMAKDTIDRAIKRGAGSGGDDANYEEILYEGYGPGGVALLIESLTDNRNRTVSEVRHALSKHGGNLGESGSVGWMFEKKGIISIEKSATEEGRLMEIALDAGADDLRDEGDTWDIVTEPNEFHGVKTALERAGVAMLSASISSIPKNTVRIEGDTVEKVLKLMDVLEDNDDVQKVHANFDIPAEELERLGG